MSRLLLRYPTLTALLITLIWGNAFVGIRYCMQPPTGTLTPLELVLARFIPALLLIGWWAATGWDRWGPPLKQHTRDLIALGLLFTWGYHYMLNIGETIILPGLAALIVACSPLFVFLIGLALGRERVTSQKVTGLALALTGLVLSVIFSDQRIGLAREGVSDRTYQFGILATLSAPLCWAIYTTGIKGLSKSADSFILTGWVMALGIVPGLFLVRQPLIAKLAVAPVPFWIALAYLSLIAAVWAVCWWGKLLHEADATTLSAFIYLVPVWSTIFSAIYFHERLTPLSGVGASLILGGLWVLNAKGRLSREGRVRAG